MCNFSVFSSPIVLFYAISETCSAKGNLDMVKGVKAGGGSEGVAEFVLDVVFVCEVRTEVRGHLSMSEELLVFAFNVLAQVGIVGGIVTDGVRGIFGFEGLETEEVLHGEFELRLAVLAATAVLVCAYGFLERGHGVEDGINDNLSACEVGTEDVETTE